MSKCFKYLFLFYKASNSNGLYTFIHFICHFWLILACILLYIAFNGSYWLPIGFYIFNSLKEKKD